MKVAVIQSSYIPWKGFFDMVALADKFVFYDDRQFTKQDWRSRNRVKGPNGPIWLTVPCGSDLNRRICDVRVSDTRWQKKHYKTICQSYQKAPFFNWIEPLLKDFYLEHTWDYLSELNQWFIERISRDFLGANTKFSRSEEWKLEGERQDRLLALLELTGATEYISGPAAKSYIDEAVFRSKGITIHWMDYSRYPEYKQLHGDFDHQVSIVDLLAHVGPQFQDFMLAFGNNGTSYSG